MSERFLSLARTLHSTAGTSPVSKYRHPLTVNTFGDEEVAAALEVLASGLMTMGERTFEFERQFACSQGGVQDAVFCNSGSSANLLAISALRLQPGDEVIVPAVTWPTTVWPIIQTGGVPVLVDVSPETLNMTVESVERAITPKTRAVFVVHLLGNPAPVVEIMRLCRDRRLALLEDACEALDAEVQDVPVGSFGRFGTYSFYFSHHICTIEGGMVVCGAGEADGLRALRAHGWTRQMSAINREQYEQSNPEIDPRFLFVDHGYNLRSTDLQAAIGLVQLKRRLGFRAMRRRIASELSRAVQGSAFESFEFAQGANPFAFPLILRTGVRRSDVIAYLEKRGVETRPLVAGNLARQPGMQRYPHVLHSLPGADVLHERALYIGIHPNTDVEYVSEVVRGV